MLYIGYSFDTSRSNKRGMRFEVVETGEIVTKERRGPVYNGITPTDGVTVTTPDEAFAALSQWIGRDWAAWSLVYVEPDDGRDPYYTVLPHAVGRTTRVRGAPVRLICSHSPRGRFIGASLHP